MSGQLREQSQDAVGDVLRRGFDGRRQQVHDGCRRHALAGIGDQSPALRGVAAHLEQSAERLGPHRGDQLRGAPPQLPRLRASDRPQLLGNLQEVADDNLVVRLHALVLVDGLRQASRLQVRVAGGAVGAPLESGACQAHPQFRVRRRAALTAKAGTAVLGNLQPAQRYLVKAHMGPGPRPLRRRVAERSGTAIGRFGQGRHHFRHLAQGETARQGDGRQTMPMQQVREGPQDGVAPVGGEALHHQAVACNANGNHRTVLEQPVDAAGQDFEGGQQGRMAGGVHRRPMQGNGEIQEELTDLPGQHRRGAGWRRRLRLGVPGLRGRIRGRKRLVVHACAATARSGPLGATVSGTRRDGDRLVPAGTDCRVRAARPGPRRVRRSRSPEPLARRRRESLRS